MSATVRAPQLVAPAFEDTDLVRSLIQREAPYWPVQRYFTNDAEYSTLSGSTTTTPMIVAPVFRGNWAALEAAPVDGVQPLLHHEPFVEAARNVFAAEIVRPHTVYVNLTWQLPFAQGAGHTDVPAFRGFDRREHPIAFLTLMGLSGLFEAERVKVATAVAWLYPGTDGGFEYWPDGPNRPSVVHEGAIDNTAIVADNDFMWHRVRPTGRREDGMAQLTLDCELVPNRNQGWSIVDGGDEVTSFDDSELRVSLSWKAEVFTDEADRARHDEHLDDLDLSSVLDRFSADLGAGAAVLTRSADPTRDPDVLDALRSAYVSFPG